MCLSSVCGSVCDLCLSSIFFFQAEDGIRDLVRSRGLGDVYKRQPNGMVQLSPDTRPDGVMDWDGCSGYHYSDSLIYGFSHTHLSGTGVADLCDVLLMPMSGPKGMAFDRTATRARFYHTREHANAGYYKVGLLTSTDSQPEDSNVIDGGGGTWINAELTATCLLYTSDAADERSSVDLGGRRIIKKKTSKKKHF